MYGLLFIRYGTKKNGASWKVWYLKIKEAFLREWIMKVTNDNIYNWPWDLKQGRKNKDLIYLAEENNLEVIIGERNYYAFSIIYSSDEMTIAKMVLPVNKYSEMESHEGDEVVNVLKGKLTINIYSDEENVNPRSVAKSSYVINEGEKMLIPENFKHVYKNLYEGNVEALIVVAPKL
jgi:cupin superfamily acireductone dioxygenase involved in methionine salvage